MQAYPLAERTIGRILGEKASRIGDREFLKWRDQTFTYADVDAITNRYARGMLDLGLGKGSTVAMMMANSPEFLWVVWALGKIGAVAVPLNTSAMGESLSYFLDQSRSEWLYVDRDLAGVFDAHMASDNGIRGVVSVGGGASILSERWRSVQTVDLAGVVAEDAGPLTLDYTVEAHDPHLIMYTSGTTGPSKGVVSPHSQAHAVGYYMALHTDYRADDVLFTCLPLFHGNALWYTVYAALWADACVALSPKFSASSFWQEIVDSGATVFNALGAMANILWQLPPGPLDRQHQVRTCMLVPTTPALVDGFASRYGIAVTSVFAMTENCPIAIYGPSEPPSKIGSAGLVRPYVDVRVKGDDGSWLPTGEIGEICARPNEPGLFMTGYFMMPEATVASTPDLWFHTGDRGHVDPDGYLYFSDRKKEAIRRRGENISAYEVEMILCKHPDVLEAAAVPVPSELSEDDVMVYVVTNPSSSPSFEELVEFCVANMAYFMVPRYWKVIDSLPKTASQKVEKYRLKAAAVEQLDDLWDRERAGIVVRRPS
jgi:crotonobetaine/carnitine-CoA ligase